MHSYSRISVKTLTVHNQFDFSEGTESTNYKELFRCRRNLVREIFRLHKAKEDLKADNSEIWLNFDPVLYAGRPFRLVYNQRLDAYQIIDSWIEVEYSQKIEKKFTELIHFDIRLAFERAVSTVFPELTELGLEFPDHHIAKHTFAEFAKFTATTTSLRTYRKYFSQIAKHTRVVRERPIRKKYQSIRIIELKQTCARLKLERRRIETIRQIAFESFKVTLRQDGVLGDLVRDFENINLVDEEDKKFWTGRKLTVEQL